MNRKKRTFLLHGVSEWEGLDCWLVSKKSHERITLAPYHHQHHATVSIYKNPLSLWNFHALISHFPPPSPSHRLLLSALFTDFLRWWWWWFSLYKNIHEVVVGELGMREGISWIFCSLILKLKGGVNIKITAKFNEVSAKDTLSSIFYVHSLVNKITMTYDEIFTLLSQTKPFTERDHWAMCVCVLKCENSEGHEEKSGVWFF